MHLKFQGAFKCTLELRCPVPRRTLERSPSTTSPSLAPSQRCLSPRHVAGDVEEHVSAMKVASHGVMIQAHTTHPIKREVRHVTGTSPAPRRP